MLGVSIRTILISLLLGALVVPLVASTPAPADVERQVRAAMLLNFMRFTTWPESAFADADSKLVLAVVGTDPFGRVLEQTFGREVVRGRSIAISRLEWPDRERFATESDFDAALVALRRELASAHVAYFVGCPREHLELLLVDSELPHLLTVGDERKCAEYSTALALDRDAGRVVFHANVRRIESLDVQVSSRLLSLARIVGERRASSEDARR